MFAYFIVAFVVAVCEGVCLFFMWKEKNHWLNKFLDTQRELLPIELEKYRGVTK